VKGPICLRQGELKHLNFERFWNLLERDARNQVLQRIYGTAFPDPKALDEYLQMLEEARKRDHRKLGRELDLFSIHEEAGPAW